MRRGQCEAIGCRAAILETEVFCRRHLLMLESDTRRVLGKTFRPGVRRQSARYLDVLALAQREILFFTTNGHHMPKDRAFEWDDEEVSLL